MDLNILDKSGFCTLLSHEEIDLREATTPTPIPIGVRLTGAPLLWKQQITGKGILVGVIDSGIDSSHPDLRGKVLFARNYVDDKLPMSSWDCHGTHVAGTIAANGVIKGVAPDAKLADYRVLGAKGGSPVAVTAAIKQAVEDGCHVINMSLGSEYDYPPMHEAIKEAVAKNVLVVAAVGNNGDANPSTIEVNYPGYYSEVVGAAAVAYNESNGSVSTWPFNCSNSEVDVCSVGYKVYSCAPGGQYTVLSGTSMASPHVSGFAALLLSKAMMRIGSGRRLPEEALYYMLKTTTVDVDTKGVDNLTGAGIVTFYPALPNKETLALQPTNVQLKEGHPVQGKVNLLEHKVESNKGQIGGQKKVENA